MTKALFYSQTIVIVFLLSIKNIVQGQQFSPINHENSVLDKNIYTAGIVTCSIVRKDSTLQSFTLDMNEDIHCIVQFQEPPITVSKSNLLKKYSSISSAISLIENEHTRFRNDLQNIEKTSNPSKSKLLKVTNTTILFEYKTAINGIAITAKRWTIEEVKKLPYVRAVFEEKKFQICDEVSNNLIGADSIRIKLGLTGKGIIIGFLDTGIDYMHPDLGGGIGPSFKVVGGYDFINSDNDPADDNGHGTHVAGIAAGNGTQLKGVAPDAKILALKVCDKNGHASSSTIIAGIERAMDPDNDPFTDDAVNIINMSFGGKGDPLDVISQSVDNASKSGIVCVAAAGNNGPVYNSVNSPGCARKALTVGAVNNVDGIASFSSRGPSDNLYEIKPDIVAPGVSITSAKMGGGYIRMDGTSMAAPHVAGCAALILQKHPDWTPDLVKSVLMESSQDIMADVWTQGSGRIDIFNASSKNVIISPASVSLGVADLSKSVYSIIDTISIYNFSTASKYYNFSLDNNFPAGLSININPASVLVNSLEEKNIIVTSTIDNNTLPFATSNPAAYVGKINAISVSDTIKIPLALIKSPGVKINFDEAPWVVHMNRSDGVFYSFGDPGTTLSTILPPGIYDIHIIYHDASTHIIKESINLNSVSTFTINKRDAVNKINLTCVDEKNIGVNAEVGIEIYSNKTSTFETWLMGAFHTQKYFSDFSDNYLWEWQASNIGNPNKFYSFNGYLSDGCKSDITQANDPMKFKHFTYNFNFKQGTREVYPVYVHGHQLLRIDTAPPLQSPFKQDIYLTPIPYRGFGEKHLIGSPYFFEMIYQYTDSPFDIYEEPLILQTPWLYIANKDTAEIWAAGENGPVDQFTESNISCGYGAPHWVGKTNNSSSSIQLSGGTDNVFNGNTNFVSNFFYYPMKDWTPLPELEFFLFQDTNFINRGKLYDLNNFSIPISPNRYTLNIHSDHYYIQGKKGVATALLDFDTRQTDKNPPFLKSLKILADKNIADSINQNQNGEIKFEVGDNSEVQHTTLEYHSELDSAWRSMTLLKDNSRYSASIPSKLPNERISIRIIAIDNSNNSLSYVLEPAFKVDGTNRSPIITTINDTTVNEDSVYTYQVQANDPDGDPVIYSLENQLSWLNINATTGILSGVPKANNKGYEIVVIRVIDDKGGSASKQFKLSIRHINHSPNPVSLSIPKNLDSLYLRKPTSPIIFRWSSSKDIDLNDSLRYIFKMIGSNLDTMISGIKDTTLQVNIMALLSLNSRYHWTVDVTDGNSIVASPDTFCVITSSAITGNDDKVETIPTKFSLSQNYPNPFNPSTVIQYQLPTVSIVRLKVFDLLGREMVTLVNEKKSPGSYQVMWKAAGLVSGVYFYSLQAGSFVDTKKLLLLK